MSELSAAYGVHSTVIAQWKRQLVRGAAEVFGRGKAAPSEEELTAPLYEEIGRLKMEIDWLKKSFERRPGETPSMDRARARPAHPDQRALAHDYEPLGTESEENLALMRVIDRLCATVAPPSRSPSHDHGRPC